LREVTAIDDQFGARDKARLVGREVQAAVSHFARLAGRFIGVDAMTSLLRSGACASVSGVSMKPGCTEFTPSPT